MDSFYDSEELRKLIKDAKIQVIALEKDQESLESENAQYEEQCARLQQEFNILSALAEAQTLEALEDAGGDEGDVQQQKKWAEMERKLEVQILNQEIRAVLPKLDADALQAELSIHGLEKKAAVVTQGQDTTTAVATSMFQKSLDELEEDMGRTVEERVKLRAKMALDADAKRKEKTALVGKISILRDQLYSLIEERESLREANKNTSLGLHGEEARIQGLLDKHDHLKSLIAPFHGGTGWQIEAFTSQTGGSREGEINVEDLSRVLAPWIPSPNADLTPGAIADCLDQIDGTSRNRKTVTLPVFVQVANLLAAC